MTAPAVDTTWTVVARREELRVDRGVAALIDGEPVAIFRLADGSLVAIDHIEPFTGVPVLARGLVGSLGDVTFVASPLHKQRFDLHTGRCLDDPSVSVRVWPIAEIDGDVCVATRPVAPVPSSIAGAPTRQVDV